MDSWIRDVGIDGWILCELSVADIMFVSERSDNVF